jgi:hypothetical protein
MAPQKLNQQISKTALKKGVITRSQNITNTNMNAGKEREVPKRKAERSPAKDTSLKRSAFGDITNVRNIYFTRTIAVLIVIRDIIAEFHNSIKVMHSVNLQYNLRKISYMTYTDLIYLCSF